MADKLTPAWCEALIAAQEREYQRASRAGFTETAKHAAEVIELARHAARALRAREWAEAQGKDADSEFKNGVVSACGVMLDILNGETP